MPRRRRARAPSHRRRRTAALSPVMAGVVGKVDTLPRMLRSHPHGRCGGSPCRQCGRGILLAPGEQFASEASRSRLRREIGFRRRSRNRFHGQRAGNRRKPKMPIADQGRRSSGIATAQLDRQGNEMQRRASRRYGAIDRPGRTGCRCSACRKAVMRGRRRVDRQRRSV